MSVDRGASFYKNVSPLVASRYKADAKTKAIPHVVVVSADGNHLLGSVNGPTAMKASGYTTIVEAVDSFLDDGTIPEQPKTFKWYLNEKGASKNLAMVGINDTGVINDHSGKKSKVTPFSTMQPGGVKFAKRYAIALEEMKFGKELKELRKDFSFPESETWTNSAGKGIEAKFVSLEGETLNLEVDKVGYAKKKYSFTLDKLDEASQANAKKWHETVTKQTAAEAALKAELK